MKKNTKPSTETAIYVFGVFFTICMIVLGVFITNTHIIYILNDKEMQHLANFALSVKENGTSENYNLKEIDSIISDPDISDEMKNILIKPESYYVNVSDKSITVGLNASKYIGKVILNSEYGSQEIIFDDGKENVIMLTIIMSILFGDLAIISYFGIYKIYKEYISQKN